jgi:hypothetical protein
MNSQSGYSHIDAVKSISNILQEPVPGSGSKLREKATETLSEPSPAPANVSVGADPRSAHREGVASEMRLYQRGPSSESREESSDIAAESNTPPASSGATLPGRSSGGSRVRSALWRVLLFFMEPIFRRLREYLLEPLVLFHERLNEKYERLNEKLDDHVAETRAATERVQLQIQVIRADLDVLPKQLVHLEFQSRNFAKQLAHLESQLGVLRDQLEHLKSQGAQTNEPP